MGQKIHPLGFRVGITRNYRSQWFSQSNHYSQLLIEDHFIRQYIVKSFPKAEITEIQIKRHLRLEDDTNKNLLKMGLQNLESLIVRIRAQHPENIVGIELTDFEKLKNCRKVLKDKLQKNRQEFLKNFNYLNTKKKLETTNHYINIYLSKVFSPCSEAYSIAHFLVEKFEKRKRVRCDVRGILNELKLVLKKRRKKLIKSRRILFKKRYQLAVNTFLNNLKKKRDKYKKIKKNFKQNEIDSAFSTVSNLKQKDISPHFQSFKTFKPLKRKGVKIQISGRLNGAEIARSLWSRKGRVPLQTLNAPIDYSYQTALTIYGLIGIKVWVFREERKPLLQGEIFFSPVEENPLLLPYNLHEKVQQVMKLKMQK